MLHIFNKPFVLLNILHASLINITNTVLQQGTLTS